MTTLAPQSSSTDSLGTTLKRGTKVYDLLAASPLILIFGVNVAGTVSLLHEAAKHLIQHPDVPLALTVLSKCAVLLFACTAIVMLFVRRPPTSGARGIGPRIASLLGTYLTIAIVLLPTAQVSPLWLGISAALILGGMAFACYSILCLGRSFSIMAEARRLVTAGPYSAIRHPLYLGEEIAIVGTTIQFFSPLGLLLLVLQMGCQVYRMHREEEVLANAFPDYASYKARTARLIPGVY